MRRAGIQPEADPVSGLHILSTVLEASEDPALRLSYETLRHIWQERPGERLLALSQGISEASPNATGPSYRQGLRPSQLPAPSLSLFFKGMVCSLRLQTTNAPSDSSSTVGVNGSMAGMFTSCAGCSQNARLRHGVVALLLIGASP